MNGEYLKRIGVFHCESFKDVARRPLATMESLAPTRPKPSSDHEKLVKGTPFDPCSDLFSVVSYNLLAPSFVRTIDKRTGEPQPYAAFQWAEPASQVLDWEVRRPRLLAELQKSRADVICLQEVEFQKDANTDKDDQSFVLPEWLRLEGYEAQLPSQHSLQQMAERNLRVLDKDVAIGCAVLVRQDRLELVNRPSGGSNTLVGVCVRGRANTALAAMDPTAVFSVHLDATSEQKRIEQVMKCLTLVREMEGREVVLAGDMNSEFFPGSCVTALLDQTPMPSAEEMALQCAQSLRLSNAEGDEDEEEQAQGTAAKAKSSEAQAPSEEQLQEWRTLWNTAREAVEAHRISLSRVATGPTRAGYDHGKDCGPCAAWSLDHVLYTRRTLTLRSSWESLEGDDVARETGLPNRECPSDHLPVAAAFVPSSVPKLSSSEEADLLRKLEALESQHAESRDALAAQLEAQKPKLPVEPAEDGQTAKEKKKKKTEKPPPEIIAHIQESRRQQRAQKEEQAKERSAFVASLGELELDVLEKVLKPSVWVESGTR